jgi:hypothetical protein
VGKRLFSLFVIATFVVLGMGSVAPALARSSAHGAGIARSPARLAARLPLLFSEGRFVAPGMIAGVGSFQNGFSRRGGRFGNYGWLGDWPYAGWPLDTTQAQVATEVPSHPEVIVISGPNNGGGRARPEDDYSYVAGCHAIPNGYHCDAPRQQSQSQ